MSGLIQNPFAAPVFDDIVKPGTRYVDIGYSYVYNVTLSANQSLQGQSVSLDRESDFILFGIQIPTVTSPLGQLQVMDNQGQQFSNDYVNFGAYMIGGLSVPFTITPGRIFAKGGRILLNIRDTSGAENTVQIVFRGLKRVTV